MSSSSAARFFVLVIAATLLGACGFHPLYGNRPAGDAAADLAQVRIEPIPDRVGQQLRNELVDMFDTRVVPESSRYVLAVKLSETTQNVAVERSQLATRANYQIDAVFSLHDTQETLFSSRRTVIASYNILLADFATLTSAQDAQTRAVRELAEAIRASLSVYFNGRREGNPPQQKQPPQQ
jgi:LPS-assembly lipoprotein